MTTNQPPAGGDVEAREAAVNAAVIEFARQIDAEIGNTGDDDYSDLMTEDEVFSINRPALGKAIVDAYLAKLTSTKPEPSRIAEIRERTENATPGPWRSMRDGNQYFDVELDPRTGKATPYPKGRGTLVGASIIPQLQRPWNPWWVGDSTSPETQETARFKDADADFIAHSRADIPYLLSHITAIEADKASLFDAIQHGDDEHKAWLKQAIADHFAGKAVEPPRGKGNKEARIAELEADRDRMREALEKISNTRQRGRLGFNEPLEEFIRRIKEIARAALTPHTEEGTPDWDDLRGVAPDATGDLSSEAFIRKQRDEWGE